MTEIIAANNCKAAELLPWESLKFAFDHLHIHNNINAYIYI